MITNNCFALLSEGWTSTTWFLYFVQSSKRDYLLLHRSTKPRSSRIKRILFRVVAYCWFVYGLQHFEFFQFLMFVLLVCWLQIFACRESSDDAKTRPADQFVTISYLYSTAGLLCLYDWVGIRDLRVWWLCFAQTLAIEFDILVLLGCLPNAFYLRQFSNLLLDLLLLLEGIPSVIIVELWEMTSMTSF